jgi:hypothetical protein
MPWRRGRESNCILLRNNTAFSLSLTPSDAYALNSKVWQQILHKPSLQQMHYTNCMYITQGNNFWEKIFPSFVSFVIEKGSHFCSFSGIAAQ